MPTKKEQFNKLTDFLRVIETLTFGSFRMNYETIGNGWQCNYDGVTVYITLPKDEVIIRLELTINADVVVHCYPNAEYFLSMLRYIGGIAVRVAAQN